LIFPFPLSDIDFFLRLPESGPFFKGVSCAFLDTQRRSSPVRRPSFPCESLSPPKRAPFREVVKPSPIGLSHPPFYFLPSSPWRAGPCRSSLPVPITVIPRDTTTWLLSFPQVFFSVSTSPIPLSSLSVPLFFPV